MTRSAKMFWIRCAHSVVLLVFYHMALDAFLEAMFFGSNATVSGFVTLVK